MANRMILYQHPCYCCSCYSHAARDSRRLPVRLETASESFLGSWHPWQTGIDENRLRPVQQRVSSSCGSSPPPMMLFAVLVVLLADSVRNRDRLLLLFLGDLRLLRLGSFDYR